MHVLIAGGGIGGVAAALTLQRAGITATVFEQVREMRELGVGINTLPHAIKELAALGLLPALDRAGIRTRELIYANCFGQVVWRELRGTDAGYDMPQFSIHRGKLHAALLDAARQRLGDDALQTGCRLVSFADRGDSVVARFERRDGGGAFEAEGDALIGADGIHSVVRAAFYPLEGPPVWNGMMLWRGATDWPVHVDGRTMVIAGGMAPKTRFLSDPCRSCHAAPAADQLGGDGAHQRQRGCRRDVRTGTARDNGTRWSRSCATGSACDFVDPLALIRATGTFYEYPMCDRDPLPRWSFRRATLLGSGASDVPVGSNGASQAILDAAALGRHLTGSGDVVAALAAYDAERRPMTTEIVLNNRKGGPEGSHRRAGTACAGWFHRCRRCSIVCGARGDRARLCLDGRLCT